MPKPRNPKRDIAHRLWLESSKKRKLKDIALELGVSESLVRKWKYEDNWDNTTLRKINNELAICVTNKKGGQPNNKNAVGGGAPTGNNNAGKTGEFESIFFDTLDDEETNLIEGVILEKKILLQQELQLLTVRERRMMKKLSNFKKDEISAVDTVMETETKKFICKMKKKSNLSTILAIEEALTRIQAQKRQLIDLLDKIERGEAEVW